jgi:outer membrane protein assembly factor BamB
VFTLTWTAVVLLSGPSGTTVRLFSLEKGGVKWEKPLHSTAGAHLTTPVHLGTDVDFTDDGSSVVILSDGRRITKLAMTDGKLEWSIEAPGAG